MTLMLSSYDEYRVARSTQLETMKPKFWYRDTILEKLCSRHFTDNISLNINRTTILMNRNAEVILTQEAHEAKM
jgi:hypothetical protein